MTCLTTCLLLGVLLAGGTPEMSEGSILSEGAVAEFPRSTFAASQVWVVSSRHAGHCDPSASQLEFYCRDEQASRWQSSTEAEFLSTDNPGVVTCFYVHGNWISHDDAMHDGWRAYRQLSSCLPANQSLRFVVWSWPSTKIEGHPLQDVRQKACVSDAHAWHLASLIDHMQPDAPICLIGYSYGARLVGGALHLLGGGRLAGHVLEHRVHSQRLPLRAVLLAGALDSPSLLPHGRNHRALSQVQRMLITVNSRDEVLHHYPLLRGLLDSGPPALGYTGFYTNCLGAEHAKVSQVNVTALVGTKHDWQRYFYCSPILSHLREFVLCEDGEDFSPVASPSREPRTLSSVSPSARR